MGSASELNIDTEGLQDKGNNDSEEESEIRHNNNIHIAITMFQKQSLSLKKLFCRSVVEEHRLEHLNIFWAFRRHAQDHTCFTRVGGGSVGQAPPFDAIGRGLGGAGFPSGKKWGFVRANQGPRYLAVNGDEGEPGTFKDRYYLERTPHLFLEGMLIAAWAVEAEKAFIYMRDEYPAVLHILAEEIKALESAGVVAPGYIDLRRGAGAYICGEESAMIESIEGKRGLPRHRPPFVAQVGIFGQPTLVHNVETLYWVTRICREGPEVLSSTELNGRRGLRSYSVSGRVKNPGVYLLAAGSTIMDVITASGGMLEDHVFKAYQPGGPSSGLLPASVNDVPLDFDTLQPLGTFIGSAAVVVLSDHDSAKDAALNMLRFFEDESCGQCTPCRVGCEKAVKLMQADNWDQPLLEDLCTAMGDASICGLGQAASNPIRSTMKHFPKEV